MKSCKTLAAILLFLTLGQMGCSGESFRSEPKSDGAEPRGSLKSSDSSGRDEMPPDKDMAACSDESFRDEAESDGAEPRVTLKFSYPPGQYEMVQAQNFDMVIKVDADGEGQTQNMKQKMTQWITMDVAQPDAKGGRDITMNFKRFKQDMTSGPMSMSLDTDDESSMAGNPAGEVFKSMLKAKITMHMNADGTVTNVQGFDALWEDIVAGNPEMAPMAEQMKQSMGDANMGELIASSQKYMPAKPVGKGAIWCAEMDLPVPMIGQLDCKAKCKLIDLSDTPAGQVATLEVKTRASSEEGKTTNMGPATMIIDSSDMTVDSVMKMNVKTGLMTEMTNKIKGQFEMSMDAAGKAMKMDMDMSGTQTVTVKQIK